MNNQQPGDKPLTDQQRIEMLEAENLRLNDELCECDSDIRYCVGAIRSLIDELGLSDLHIPESGNMAMMTGQITTKLMMKLPSLDFNGLMAKVNLSKIIELSKKYKHLID